jgi:REP element-mobilizing transposase RayT
MNLLIKSAIARTQRNFKVYICHHVWMGNHAHLLVISRDARELATFYGELQKRLTDYLKRLLGLSHLDLWEGDCSVIRIADYEAAIERIAYFYANPARANLVNSIESYPGLSSYEAFNSAKDSLFAHRIERTVWVRCPAVPKLPSRTLTEGQDKRLADLLMQNAKKARFATFPHLWLRCFGLSTPADVREAKELVRDQITSLEAAARAERDAAGLRTFGAKILRRQPVLKDHIPKKYSRRIFVIARDKDVRLSYIRQVHEICALCDECYRRWQRGDYNFIWPPGTFPPPYPMSANVLADAA